MNKLHRLGAIVSTRCRISGRGRLLAVMAAHLLLSQPAAAELINVNNFEAATAGFTTVYANSPTFLDGPGLSGLVQNPGAVFEQFGHFGDHTTGSGLMLAVNGATIPNQVVWEQTIAVTPNTNYQFTAWTASMHPASPAELDVLANDTVLGSTTLTSTVGVWNPFSASWNSGSATSVTLQIFDRNTIFHGNDFALDDIQLTASLDPTETAPEPSALVLFSLGAVGSLASYYRRRKAVV